jgi:hypothetical protein
MKAKLPKGFTPVRGRPPKPGPMTDKEKHLEHRVFLAEFNEEWPNIPDEHDVPRGG